MKKKLRKKTISCAPSLPSPFSFFLSFSLKNTRLIANPEATPVDLGVTIKPDPALDNGAEEALVAF